MTKYCLRILNTLKDNAIQSSAKALSISQILSLLGDEQRKSYSTLYRHLLSMVKQGYVQCGLVDGLASTYFITQKGMDFCRLNI